MRGRSLCLFDLDFLIGQWQHITRQADAWSAERRLLTVSSPSPLHPRPLSYIPPLWPDRVRLCPSVSVCKGGLGVCCVGGGGWFRGKAAQSAVNHNHKSPLRSLRGEHTQACDVSHATHRPPPSRLSLCSRAHHNSSTALMYQRLHIDIFWMPLYKWITRALLLCVPTVNAEVCGEKKGDSTEEHT